MGAVECRWPRRWALICRERGREGGREAGREGGKEGMRF